MSETNATETRVAVEGSEPVAVETPKAEIAPESTRARRKAERNVATKEKTERKPLRLPQIRILRYLADGRTATRREISEGAPVDLAWCTEWVGSEIDSVREKNDTKPGGFPSLVSLGAVVASKADVNGKDVGIYRISARGRRLLASEEKRLASEPARKERKPSAPRARKEKPTASNPYGFDTVPDYVAPNPTAECEALAYAAA